MDPSGMDTVHTPNGIANVGDGYRATPDGQYLYGEGLQPKRWNPNLEIGSIVGDGFRGGYENCDESELPLIQNESIINLANIAVPVAVPIGAFLWEHISTAAGAAIEAVTTIAWIIPVSLLVSGDIRQCATDNGNDDVQTSAGQKTDRYGNVLGGSGKPRVNKSITPHKRKPKMRQETKGKVDQ